MRTQTLIAASLFAVTAMALPKTSMRKRSVIEVSQADCDPTATPVNNAAWQNIVTRFTNNIHGAGVPNPIPIGSRKDSIVTINSNGVKIIITNPLPSTQTFNLGLVDLAEAIGSLQADCCDDVSATCPAGTGQFSVQLVEGEGQDTIRISVQAP